MEPTKEQMYQWYVVEKLSYRKIMDLINTKNNRKIPKLLKEYGIEIRRGSEAVKTQWLNNESRRKSQGDMLSEILQGKPSHRRLEIKELEDRYKNTGLQVLNVVYQGGKKHARITLKCLMCGKQSEKSIANSSMECVYCQVDKGIARTKKNYKEVKRAFDERGLILLETEYAGNKTKMSCVCKEHPDAGPFFISYESVKSNKGCKLCFSKSISEKNRTPFEKVQEVFNNSDMVLIDTEYADIDTPMAFICINHVSEGIQYKSLYSVKKNGKCKFCNMEERHKNKGATDRQLYEYHLKRWRISVFERDGYTCQCCGDKKGGNLNAHHIENFSSNKEGRLDVNNGITLCETCHNPVIKGSFHNVYGTRNNNKEQLENYISSKKASIL